VLHEHRERVWRGADLLCVPAWVMGSGGISMDLLLAAGSI